MSWSSSVLLVVCLCAAGCGTAETVSDQSVEKSRAAPGSDPLADTCTPGAGPVYATCRDALAATSSTSGCFQVGTVTSFSSRQCMKKRVLLAQLDNDGQPPQPPPADAPYLDAMIEGMKDYFDVVSYGRLVLDVEVAGNKSETRARRWYVEAYTDQFHPNLYLSWCNGETDHPLDWYDVVGTLLTASNSMGAGKKTARIPFVSDCTNQATSEAVVALFRTAKYREVGETNWNSSPAHEPGHALGLLHDHSFSTRSGRAAFGPLTGEQIEYGGPVTCMGADGRGETSQLTLQERVSLGFLNDGLAGGGRHVKAVTGSGTWVFDTLEPNVEGLKGLYVPTSTGGYWVEARRDPSLEPSFQSGILIHHQLTGETFEKSMIDSTFDSPSDKGEGLPLGRTFSDLANRIHITAVSETPLTATVQVVRNPVNNRAPVLAAVAPPVLLAPNLYRFTAAATDRDGDPLSYSWRFGDADVSGATVDRIMAAVVAMRVFVTVTDRKGGVANGYVDFPNPKTYSDAWTAPVAGTVFVTPLEYSEWERDNEFAFEVTFLSTREQPAFAWTLQGASRLWTRPIESHAAVNASAPPCLTYTVTVSDATNCATHADCSLSRSGCFPTPIRLVFEPIRRQATVSFSSNLFYGSTTISWSSPTCTLTGFGATVTVAGSRCELLAKVNGTDAFGKQHTYAARVFAQ